MAPKISIIVPCYNQAQYLDECLQSVLDQTYQDWECIIVNDGSPDNTEEIAKKWVEKDSRFKYLYKENGGVASARNLAIKNAVGEWILPLDGDDKIAIDYLNLASQQFKNNYAIIYCEAQFFGAIKNKWVLPNFNYNVFLQNNIIFCTAFFRKTDWRKVSGYDENLVHGFEDWDFWLGIINKDSNILKLDYLGFSYRQIETSRANTINKNQKKIDESYNYIFNKHLEKYIGKSNLIDFYTEHTELEKQKKNLEEQLTKQNNLLYKNKISRLLFKIIKKL